MDPDSETPCTFEVERKQAILVFEDDGSIAIIKIIVKRIDSDCGECSGRKCSYKVSFYRN